MTPRRPQNVPEAEPNFEALLVKFESTTRGTDAKCDIRPNPSCAGRVRLQGI